MRQFLLFILMSSSTFVFAQEVSIQFEQANQLYRNGEYQKAAMMYEQVLKNGYENTALYYNLGDAYFKVQNISASILNYERAKRLAPHDEDVLYNLRLANLRVIDKIEPIPHLFFIEWWQSFMNMLSSEGWAITAIISLWSALFFGSVFLLFHSLILQRIVFFLAIACVLISLLAFVGTFHQGQHERSQQHAIVFSPSVSVKSAPDAQSTDLFVIHDGVKVELLDAVGEWKKIRLSDGKVGWIAREMVRVI
jgi:tetratricopeptide (TPR) repeat protein